MSIKCFCDSCGKEIDNPKKCINIIINGVPHLPDLCEECTKKIIDIAYKYNGVLYYDDEK